MSGVTDWRYAQVSQFYSKTVDSKSSCLLHTHYPLLFLIDSRVSSLEIACRSTNPYRLVRRAQLILFAAKGVSNTEIGQQLQLSRSRVRFWRERWQRAAESLTAAEAEGISDSGLMGQIVEVLNDELRPGTPAHFNLEPGV